LRIKEEDTLLNHHEHDDDDDDDDDLSLNDCDIGIKIIVVFFIFHVKIFLSLISFKHEIPYSTFNYVLGIS
jgi:hypothetical protein